MSHETHASHSPADQLDPELHQLKIQLAAIQEQQRLQTLMIKQFQQQLKAYQQRQQQAGNEGKSRFDRTRHSMVKSASS